MTWNGKRVFLLLFRSEHHTILQLTLMFLKVIYFFLIDFGKFLAQSEMYMIATMVKNKNSIKMNWIYIATDCHVNVEVKIEATTKTKHEIKNGIWFEHVIKEDKLMFMLIGSDATFLYVHMYICTKMKLRTSVTLYSQLKRLKKVCKHWMPFSLLKQINNNTCTERIAQNLRNLGKKNIRHKSGG